MAHLRETLMQTLAANLTSGVPFVSGRVFRRHEREGADQPLVLVYQSTEDYEPDDMNTLMTPKLMVKIVGITNDTGEVTADINELDRQIWIAVEADPTLGGNAIDVEQVKTEFRLIDKGAEFDLKDEALVEIKTIKITYRVQRTDPEIIG